MMFLSYKPIAGSLRQTEQRILCHFAFRLSFWASAKNLNDRGARSFVPQDDRYTACRPDEVPAHSALQLRILCHSKRQRRIL